MNDLFNTLLTRQTGAPAPVPSQLPSPHATVPPAWKRFQNAQQMQDAYWNDWSPNPLLLRAMLGRFS